jgi:hypothetical protein
MAARLVLRSNALWQALQSNGTPKTPPMSQRRGMQMLISRSAHRRGSDGDHHGAIADVSGFPAFPLFHQSDF